jgi:hypothetical protein
MMKMMRFSGRKITAEAPLFQPRRAQGAAPGGGGQQAALSRENQAQGKFVGFSRAQRVDFSSEFFSTNSCPEFFQ